MEDKDDLSALEVRVLINRLRASPHGSEGMLYGIRIARSIKSPIMDLAALNSYKAYYYEEFG